MSALVLGWGAVGPGGSGEHALEGAVAGVGRVDGFDVGEHVRLRGLRPLSRASGLASAAAVGALAHPAEPPGEPDARAVVVGSRWGHVDPLFEFERSAALDGPALVNPSRFPNVVANVHAGYLGILFGLAGPNVTLCGAAAGLEAVGLALDLLALGRAEVALAGGVEALGPALAEADARDGARAGEGAAFLLLGREPAGREPLAEAVAFGTGEESVGALLDTPGLGGTVVAPAPPQGRRLAGPVESTARFAGECQAAGGALAAAAAVVRARRTGRPVVAAAFPERGEPCALLVSPMPPR